MKVFEWSAVIYYVGTMLQSVVDSAAPGGEPRVWGASGDQWVLTAERLHNHLVMATLFQQPH